MSDNNRPGLTPLMQSLMGTLDQNPNVPEDPHAHVPIEMGIRIESIDTGMVRLTFPRSVTWIEFSGEQAKEIAAGIIKHADIAIDHRDNKPRIVMP